MTAAVHDLRSCHLSGPGPLNIEAEQALLGSALMNNDLIKPLVEILQPEHFGEEIHKRIFDLAVELHSRGKPATPATLKTYLGDTDLGGITIPQYLARVAAEAAPPLTAFALAREVRDLASRRQMIGIGERLSAAARDSRPASLASELAAEALADLHQIAEDAPSADTRRDPGACAVAIVERARSIMRGEQTDAGVSTGLADLDRATGGFQPGTLWVVGGRPRMGKTILATGFARKVASRGARDLEEGRPACGAQIFSFEVGENEIVSRVLADLAYLSRRPITFGQILRGELDDTEIWAVEEAQQKLTTLPLALDVAPSLTVVEIGARVRAEKARMAKRGVRLATITIDYLKFVRATDRYRGNRVYEVGEITRGLKELAKTEGVCVLLLAQVNRAVDSRDRKDRAPGLSDLRESGDLEADADVVLFIDRESVRIKQSPEFKAGEQHVVERFINLQNSADLIVAKTRTGSETTIKVWFDAGASTFASHARGGQA